MSRTRFVEQELLALFEDRTDYHDHPIHTGILHPTLTPQKAADRLINLRFKDGSSVIVAVWGSTP